MALGQNILELRKKNGLSQENLGEKVNVTRQTISNWELGETFPNPEQLKQLSKALKVSVDELLDNDIKDGLVAKVSNTEKLAGMIIKALKILGILFLVMLFIDILAFALYSVNKKTKVGHNIERVILTCNIKENDYVISIGSDEYFNCSNCDKKIQKDLKDNYVDFNDLRKTEKNIIDFFDSNNGSCK